MKTTQDYISQVLAAYRTMLHKYCTSQIEHDANVTHTNMLVIAYQMILRGEY